MEEKAEGKMKNYKLKHSRIMTCYSAIIFLLHAYSEKGTVTERDAYSMLQLAPTHRIAELIKRTNRSVRGVFTQLLDQYAMFLSVTNVHEKELVEQFKDRERYKILMREGNQFGKLFLDALSLIGAGNDFHRIVIV